MNVLEMVESTLKEIKGIDSISFSLQKDKTEERLTIIKNALIIGDLNKDYSKEEVNKLKNEL